MANTRFHGGNIEQLARYYLDTAFAISKSDPVCLAYAPTLRARSSPDHRWAREPLPDAAMVSAMMPITQWSVP